MPTIVAYVHAYVPKHNAGAETTLHDILRYLVEEGWQAHVVVKSRELTGSQMDYEIDGVQVHEGDRKILTKYIAKADITISHLECSQITHRVSRMWGKPSIHLVHNTHPLTKQWSASADALIFNTEWIANSETFAGKSFISMPKMVLHPPVSPSRYKTDKGKKITLVNLWEDKGSEIFYYLAESFPNLEFLGVKGGYGEQVIQSGKNITIMEHTSDMKKVYGETKVLLMPSKHESYGRVGVEAMASGIPVLAEPTDGLRESLGDAGTYAPRDLPEEWKKSLTELLKPARYGKMSKLATARSEELSKKSQMEMQTLSVFTSELIRTKTGRPR